MPFVEDDHAVQNLVLQSLNHSSTCARRFGARGSILGTVTPYLAKDLIEGGWVLYVVVAEEDRQREIGDLRILLQPLRLLCDPSGIGLASGGREPESA